MKNSFIIYNSFYEPLKNLSDEQLGKLFRAIFNYTINGEITQDNDILIAFMFIKNQLDIDNEKYQDIKQKRSEAGKKHKGNQYTKGNKMEQMEQNGTNGSDNDNVNDNVINKKKNIKKKSYFENEELNNIFLEFLDIRKKKKAVNSERAINMLLKKLSPFDDDTKFKLIERSVLNSWKDIYEDNNNTKKSEERELKQLSKNGFQL